MKCQRNNGRPGGKSRFQLLDSLFDFNYGYKDNKSSDLDGVCAVLFSSSSLKISGLSSKFTDESSSGSSVEVSP